MDDLESKSPSQTSLAEKVIGAGDERNPACLPAVVGPWAVLAPLSVLLNYLFMFSGLLATWLIWLLNKEAKPFVARHAAQSFNFQLWLTTVALVLCVPLGLALFGLGKFGAQLLPLEALKISMYIVTGIFIVCILAIAIGQLTFAFVNAVRASRGQEPKYFAQLKILK
jgi:uncharacterized Tic20 family protein